MESAQLDLDQALESAPPFHSNIPTCRGQCVQRLFPRQVVVLGLLWPRALTLPSMGTAFLQLCFFRTLMWNDDQTKAINCFVILTALSLSVTVVHDLSLGYLKDYPKVWDEGRMRGWCLPTKIYPWLNILLQKSFCELHGMTLQTASAHGPSFGNSFCTMS